MTNPHVVLYHDLPCPYCKRVRDFLASENIQIPMKDIMADPEYWNELLTVGGKGQVPCLFIDGKPLYESLDIIEWFKTHWQNA